MPLTGPEMLRFSRRMEKFYARQFEPLLRQTDLSMREIQVLLFLANNPACDTARDVTELRGLAKSQVSQAVELLAARGLLQRTPDGADRRVVHLRITESGVPLARQAQHIQQQWGIQLLSGLTPAEAAQFHALLEKVRAQVETLMEKEILE